MWPTRMFEDALGFTGDLGAEMRLLASVAYGFFFVGEEPSQLPIGDKALEDYLVRKTRSHLRQVEIRVGPRALSLRATVAWLWTRTGVRLVLADQAFDAYGGLGRLRFRVVECALEPAPSWFNALTTRLAEAYVRWRFGHGLVEHFAARLSFARVEGAILTLHPAEVPGVERARHVSRDGQSDRPRDGQRDRVIDAERDRRIEQVPVERRGRPR